LELDIEIYLGFGICSCREYLTQAMPGQNDGEFEIRED
jgi:hypothetical protein